MAENTFIKEEKVKEQVNCKPELEAYELEENKDFTPCLDNMVQLQSELVDLHFLMFESNFTLDLVKNALSSFKTSSDIDILHDDFTKLNWGISEAMEDSFNLIKKIEKVHDLSYDYLEDLNELMGYFD